MLLPLPRNKNFVVVFAVKLPYTTFTMEDLCDVLGDKNKQDDFYSLLGCDELATTEQINAEFRQKAKECHPDKNPGDQAAKKLFERFVNYTSGVLTRLLLEEKCCRSVFRMLDTLQ